MKLVLVLVLLLTVSAEVRTLVPPWGFVYLSTTSDEGAFVLNSWSWVQSTLPSLDFCISVWLNILSPTGAMPDHILIESDGKSLSLALNLDSGVDFSFLASDVFEKTHAIPGYGVWYHVVFGVSGNSVYYILTYRVGTQFSDTQDYDFPLTSTAVITAPSCYGDQFKVSSM